MLTQYTMMQKTKAKHLEDKSKLDQLLTIFDERKKQPIDYRRSGVISIFVGLELNKKLINRMIITIMKKS